MSDGDPISTWPDISGNGIDATATTGEEPTFKTGIFGSNPSVRFTASGQKFSFTGVDLAGGATIYVVWNETSPVLYGGPLAFSLGTSGKYGLMFNNNSDNSHFFQPNINVYLGDTIIIAKSAETESHDISVSPRGPTIDVWTSDMSSSMTYRRNGSNVALDSGGTWPVQSGQQRIGAAYTTVLADIAAIIVYNAEHTTEEMQAMEAYLNAKYPCF